MVKGLAPAHQFVYAGASLNVYHANKGEGLQKHDHTWNHATICQAGSCRVSLDCLLYTSPSPRDRTRSRMPSSA